MFNKKTILNGTHEINYILPDLLILITVTFSLYIYIYFTFIVFYNSNFKLYFKTLISELNLLKKNIF